MGTERLLQDGILCELYEEKLQENVQTVLTWILIYYKLFLVWSCVSLMCYKTLIASLHPNLTADARENWHVQCIATFCWKKFLHFTLVYNLSFFTPEKCRAQLVAPALCSPKYTLRLKYGKFDMIICSNFHRHARKIGFLSENYKFTG